MRKFVSLLALVAIAVPFGFWGTPAKAANTTLSTFATTGMAMDVAVYGNYAYVGESSAGIQIVNISNTSSPTLAGTYSATGANHIFISGSTLYAADGISLSILGLSDPANPSLLGTYSEVGFAPGNVVSDGTYAYVTGIMNSSSFVVKAIDVSTPSAPVLRGTLTVDGAADIAISGSTLYVAYNYKMVTIAGYPTFSILGTYTNFDTSAGFQGVTVSNNTAYLYDTTTGLVAVNVTDPANPALHLSTTGRYGSGMVVSGNYGYLAGYFTGGLYVIDLSSSTALTLVNTFSGSGNGFAVALHGTSVVVAANGDAGIRLFDISNPTTTEPGSTPPEPTTGTTPGTTPSTDPAAPTITLKGSGVVYLGAGTKYSEPGYTATDFLGNLLTTSVTVTSKLDINKVGRYTQTYTVKDSAGKSNVANRYIVVMPTVAKQTVKNGRLTIKVGKKNVTLRPFPKYSGNVVAYKIAVKNISQFQYLFLNTDATSAPEIVLYSSAGKLQKRYSLKGISKKGLNYSIVADPSTLYALIAIAPKTGSLQVTQYGLASNGLKNLGKVIAASGKGTVVFAQLKVYPNAYSLVTLVRGSTAKPKVWLYFPPAGKITQDKSYDTKKLSWNKTSVKLK
jgi:hypothetical protein